MTSLAANRSYKLLFSAHAVSNLGDGVSSLAFPWLATLLTRDPVLIGLVTAAGKLPWLLFSIPAGVMTDRLDRQTLIVRADLLRFLLTCGVLAMIFAIPALPVTDGSGWVLMLGVLAFLLGCAEVVRDNAAQTVLPSVVEDTQLERANGQLWSVEHVMGHFIGPPLAGVLIALAVPAPFALDALTFAIAAGLVWMMTIPRRPPVARRSLRVEFAEAWDWMRAHPVILRLAVMLGLMNMLHLMATTVLVLIAQERLGLSAFGYGVLLTAGAAGGVVGGLLGPKLIARLGGTQSVRLALALMPLPFVLIAVAPSAWVVALALFCETVLALTWNIVTVSFRQRVIPDALLGRVNSLYRCFGWGMMPLGAVLGGALVTAFEPSLGRSLALSVPYVLGAAGTIALAVYGWSRLSLQPRTD